MTYDIVDTDTGLTGVLEFCKSNFKSSIINIGSLIHDHWAFTSELKNTWDEILSCCLSDKFTLFCGACEADEVKGMLSDLNRELNIADK